MSRWERGPLAPTGRPHVLFVGPDPGIGAAIILGLGRVAHVETEATVSDAFAAAARWAPRIVIMDVQAADSEALCFTRTLARHLPDCAVLLLTAAVEDAVHEQAAAFGAIVLRKPLDLGVLLPRASGLLAPLGDGASFTSRPHTYVCAALEYLAVHYAERLTAKRLGQAASVSASHLAQMFRLTHGTSLRHGMVEFRIEVTKQLLTHSEDKLQTIAEQVGFADGSHLARVFRRYTGRPPSHYRRECRRMRFAAADVSRRPLVSVGGTRER